MRTETNTVFSSQEQLDNLLQSKMKTISIFERLIMGYFGRRDGKSGLARQDVRGNWTSPLLMQEEHMLHEMSDKLWGKTQLELHDHYVSVAVLIDEIDKLESLLEEVTQESPLQPNEDYFTHRKGAEGGLTDGQVRARREAELLRQHAPYQTRVAALESRLQEMYQELFYKRNHIVEVNNATRLISERMKFHIEQRRAAYWNAVLRVHPDKDKLPVCLDELEDSKTELTYMSAHKELENIISEMIVRKSRLTGLKYGFQEENNEIF